MATNEIAVSEEFDSAALLEELRNHPAFLTKVPADGEFSEALEALQAMKYDEEDPPDSTND